LGFQAFAGLDPWSLGGHRITESESCRGYERPFRPGFSLAEEGLRYRTLEGWPGLVSFRKSQRNVSSAKDCREGLKLPSRAPFFPQVSIRITSKYLVQNPSAEQQPAGQRKP
jgi:hypothetical protein